MLIVISALSGFLLMFWILPELRRIQRRRAAIAEFIRRRSF